MTKVKVLIVEPNDLVRDSLRSILDLEGSFQVIGDARHFALLEEHLGGGQPDVVILDHDSPGWSEIVRRARGGSNHVGFLLLSTLLDESAGSVALGDDGARVMCKSASPAQLFAAVRDVAGAASNARGDGEIEPRGVGSIDSTGAIRGVHSASAPSLLSGDRGEERAGWLRRLLTLGLHFVSLALLSSVFGPLARWYAASQPPLGFDFWQFVYYVNYLRENFGFFTSMWKYTWHSGEPFARDYVMGHMYATLPLAQYFGDTLGSKIYLLIALFAFAAACYFLFFSISRNHLLALALASVNLWSPNTVNALIRDGWASFSASQVFLPLSFVFVVRFFQSGNRKFAIAAAAVSGLAFAGHSIAGLLTSIFSFTLLFFGLLFWPRLRRGTQWTLLPLYVLIASGVGLVFAFPLITSTVALRAVRPQGIRGEVFEYALSGLVTGTNPLMFLLLAFALVLVGPRVMRAMRGRGGNLRVSLSRTSPFLCLMLLLIAVEASYLVGRSPLQAAGGPNRTWWIGGILLGCLVSAITTWGQNGPRDEQERSHFWKSKGFQHKVWASMIYFLIMSSASAVTFDAIKTMAMGVGAPTPTTFEALLKLGIERPNPDTLAKDLAPGVDMQSIQHRMWTSNPMLALVWNALFPMPTAKGYFTQALRPSWDFWRDSSINGQLYAAEKVPLDLARNNALFHLDWYAIKYLEPPIAPYITDGMVPRGKENGLSFLEVMNPSKIVEPTNAAAILVVGDPIGYDVVVRSLASQNLNSQQFITVRGATLA